MEQKRIHDMILTVLFTPDRMRYIALLMSSYTTGISACKAALVATSDVEAGLVHRISDSLIPLQNDRMRQKGCRSLFRWVLRRNSFFIDNTNQGSQWWRDQNFACVVYHFGFVERNWREKSSMCCPLTQVVGYQHYYSNTHNGINMGPTSRSK